MKKYLLLRNNRESGPYSIEQLGSMGLFPLDLIWIENESTSWKHPEEFEQLALLIINDDTVRPAIENASALNEQIPASFSRNTNWNEEEHLLAANEAQETDELYNTNFAEEFKENYSIGNTNKPVWKRKLFSATNTANVAAIFIGVMIGAFVVKKIVDDYTPDSEDAIAIPILDREPTPQADANFQNALVKEIVPPVRSKSLKNSKQSSIKKQLKIKANNYKVGLFGGINGLQLTIFNSSAQVADKVVVTVDYIKPNGTVVQSENVVFSSILPKSSQTITVSGSSRGVKIKYRIIKVDAHSYKEDLKEV